MKHFLKGGGTVEGGVRQDEIISQVLQSKNCVREIQSDAAGDVNSGNKVF